MKGRTHMLRVLYNLTA